MVVDFLKEHGINKIHCGKHGSREILEDTVNMVENAVIKDWGDRTRYYLSNEQWTKTKIDYEIPWIAQELVLD